MDQDDNLMSADISIFKFDYFHDIIIDKHG